MRKLSKALVYFLSIVALSGGAVTATASPHPGVVQVWDGLEGATPWTRWQGGGSGDGVAGYDINGGVAHWDRNNGWLHVGNGWAANRIPVNISQWTHHNCAVGVWINPLASGAQVGLQVWNPNGWHIIAEIYPWVAGGGYKQISISGLDLRPFSGDIYLQVIYGNSSGAKTFVRFDDMAISCFF